ncbi:MAG: MBL fold metallo-hydrolase [Acetobacteraceae bacterium]
MPAHICTTCGTQYPNAETPPGACVICRDERQYVNPMGQAWTTMADLRRSHFNTFRRHEPDLMGIGTLPHFAIGQRALLLHTPHGNILWDCISFLDDATVSIIGALGGIAGIAISHPHFYASMIEWSHAFDAAPVYLHAADRKFVTRLDPAITFWEDDEREILPGVNLIRCGGHFMGSTVLHWAQGAGGRGALLTGDTIQVGPDNHVSFMRSYPNLVPLDTSSVRQIADTLQTWQFDTIYGGWWDRIIATDARAVLSRSVQRYVQALSHPPVG